MSIAPQEGWKWEAKERKKRSFLNAFTQIEKPETPPHTRLVVVDELSTLIMQIEFVEWRNPPPRNFWFHFSPLNNVELITMIMIKYVNFTWKIKIYFKLISFYSSLDDDIIYLHTMNGKFVSYQKAEKRVDEATKST